MIYIGLLGLVCLLFGFFLSCAQGLTYGPTRPVEKWAAIGLMCAGGAALLACVVL